MPSPSRTLILFLLPIGLASAQTPGMMGGSPGTPMMAGRQGSGMMAGQGMQGEMMRDMVGTMTGMNRMMQRMAGAMDQGGPGMDTQAMADLSKAMEDMAGMMHTLAANLREGRMDQATLKNMDTRLKAMGKTLAPMTAAKP